MKRYFIPLLVLCLAGVVAFAIASRSSTTAGISLDCLNNTDLLARKLSLDARQAAELAKLQADYKTRLDAAGIAHCAACCGLRTILFDGNNDEKIKAQVEAMSSAQKESELLTLKHIRDVYALLNADQKKDFEKLVKICIGGCSSSGKCACNCGGAPGTMPPESNPVQKQ